jgi:ubiquinone/menaquinone biosynthesis C-methylase UbiE
MNNVYFAKKLLEISEMKNKTRKLSIKKVKEKLKKRINKFRRYRFYVNGRVLDVGTGSGIDLLALFSINPKIEVVGVDISKKALKFARDILPKDETHLVQADVTSLPFIKETFSAVNVSYMLHHHPPKLLRRIIGNLTAILRQNGIMLINEPSVESEADALREEIYTLKYDLKNYLKVRRKVSSTDTQSHLYSLVSIFDYDTMYPSLLKQILLENDLKIEHFEIITEKFDRKEAKKLIATIKMQIKRSDIPNYEKVYLLDKSNALDEKLKLIDPAGDQSIVFKVKKTTRTLKERKQMSYRVNLQPHTKPYVEP